MALTKITSGAVSGLATSATTDTTDASNITTGTIPTGRLASALDLSGKTVTLPAASVTAHATNPTKSSIEALGIDASTLTGSLPAISGANLTGIETVTKSTTAPASPALGDMWFDTTLYLMKVWNNVGWRTMSTTALVATGGTISTYSVGSDNFKVHTFTSSGTFTISGAAGTVDVLIVAGGGAGGAGTGAGGGAGGLIYKTTLPVSASAFSVVVGSGGVNDSVATGTNGSNTTFNSLTALGGGYGASTETGSAVFSANSGGSGGGDTTYYAGGSTPGSATQPSSASGGFGNVGGDGAGGNSGGGGGADAAGNGSNGGSGKQYSIRTGVNSWYAAGGSGGSVGTTSTNGIGGYHATNGTNGVVNTGSGGGGGWGHASSTGGNGGSGIVIVRYAV